MGNFSTAMDLLERVGEFEGKKWRNLYFDIKGNSYIGRDVHDNEDDAIAGIAETMGQREDSIIFSFKNGTVHSMNVTHGIPMPIREG